jgi:large subunit ribosomal protein L4
MPSIKVYSQDGKEAGTLALADAVFGCEVNEALIHQVVVAQLNNKRQGTKSALTRTEVRGGGKKPWRQKHTGRARQGSTRSPQWTGGGVVFAPKPRDFSQKVNKQMKAAAMLSALSAKVRDDEFVVLDKLAIAAPKTREVAKILDALKLEKSVILITAEHSEDILRAGSNIPNLTIAPAELINVYDIISHSKCLITTEAVKKIEEAYGA